MCQREKNFMSRSATELSKLLDITMQDSDNSPGSVLGQQKLGSPSVTMDSNSEKFAWQKKV